MTKDRSLLHLIVVLCLALTTPAHAASPAQIDAARNAGLGWLIQNQRGDGDWSHPGGAALPATSAAAAALRSAGATGYPHARAIAWLMNADPRSIDGRGRNVCI